MEAIEFKGCNVTFAEDQPEYHSLPGHIDRLSIDGVLTTCWKFTFRERLRILFSGELFLQILTFHKPLQPLRLLLYNPITKKKVE